MTRSTVHVRPAAPDDVGALLALWGEFTRRSLEPRAVEAAEADALSAVLRIASEPDERLLVAVVDDTVVGASHLVRSTISPIHCETAIYITHLHVADGFRRRGVGRALMESAVTWAEEKDTGHVLAAASANSRDANRFMARLGLAQIAVVRGSATGALRNKLPVEPPAAARVGSRSHRNVGQVLAQRRSQRRAQEKIT